MRLSSDGEQPLDKYVRFKNDINQWYEEMDSFNLSKVEQGILVNHLLDRYGICDTQEGLMMLVMDENISNFDLTQSNKFRKTVASKKIKEIEKFEEIFYKQGKEAGTSQELLYYVWEMLLKPQFGYAFSLPHIAGYTLILMIEMNICYRYGPIYWKTACLSVNAGLAGEDKEGTDYGAIAKAIGDMHRNVKNPSINSSELGFTPLEDQNKILFGLKPIVGLGVEAMEQIIEKRPYASIEDFHERITDVNILSQGKVVALIKAGVFDEFNTDRKNVMIEFVRRVTPKKEKLTMTQLPKVLHLVDQEKFKTELDLYNFKKKAFGSKKIPMNKEMERYFISTLKDHVLYDFDNGALQVDQKSFDKYYDKNMDALKDLLKEPEIVDEFNKLQMRNFWKKHCLGSVELWEMQTTNFYHNKHELDNMPIHNYFSHIADFSELPEDPEVERFKTYNGVQRPQFFTTLIAGTVVDKDKQKSLVHISTQYGVVMVKVPKGQYAYYDSKHVEINGKDKKVIDGSWFDRGTKIVVVGFRRGNTFVPRKTGSIYNHSIMKIQSYNQNEIKFLMQKAG